MIVRIIGEDDKEISEDLYDKQSELILCSLYCIRRPFTKLHLFFNKERFLILAALTRNNSLKEVHFSDKIRYISALDLETNKIIWTSKPLICNSNFVIYGDYIITGYGFTDEPNYLYIIDKFNGAFMKKVSLANTPEIIGMRGNHIFVRTYSYEYEFMIQ